MQRELCIFAYNKEYKHERRIPTIRANKFTRERCSRTTKNEIYRKDKPLKTIRQRIGELTAEDRSTLLSIAQIVLAFQQATISSEGVTDIDYRSLIERLYKGLKPKLKVLLADVLQEIEPVKVVAKKEAKPLGRSIYEDERYFLKRDLLSTSAKDYYDKSSGSV